MTKEKKLTGNIIEDHKKLYRKWRENVKHPNRKKEIRTGIANVILGVFLCVIGLFFWPLFLFGLFFVVVGMIRAFHHWIKSAEEPKKTT